MWVVCDRARLRGRIGQYRGKSAAITDSAPTQNLDQGILIIHIGRDGVTTAAYNPWPTEQYR